MLKLFEQMLADNLTPNGLYFLMILAEGTGIKLIDYKAEKKLLEDNGFIIDNKVTDHAKNLVKKYKERFKKETKDIVRKKTSFSLSEEAFIYEYKDIFPPGLLPHGYPSRLSFKELEKRFLWFFDNYQYSWEVILKATKMYVNKYKDENYMYMKTSGYFIVKSEKGITVSTLATYCDMILESPNSQIVIRTDSGDGYNSAI